VFSYTCWCYNSSSTCWLVIVTIFTSNKWQMWENAWSFNFKFPSYSECIVKKQSSEILSFFCQQSLVYFIIHCFCTKCLLTLTGLSVSSLASPFSISIVRLHLLSVSWICSNLNSTPDESLLLKYQKWKFLKTPYSMPFHTYCSIHWKLKVISICLIVMKNLTWLRKEGTFFRRLTNSISLLSVCLWTISHICAPSFINLIL
jgi:hypothetical protein